MSDCSEKNVQTTRLVVNMFQKKEKKKQTVQQQQRKTVTINRKMFPFI